MRIKHHRISYFRVIYPFIIFGLKLHPTLAQARFIPQLNANKLHVQLLDYSTRVSNIIPFGNFHLGLFCNSDYKYKLYISDSQTKNWEYIKSPHEGKNTFTDFIETDSNIFFFAWKNTYMYLYSIDKDKEILIRTLDSFKIKNNKFTTFWKFTDPKSSFFVISISLTAIDSTYFYAVNKYGMNIIRKYDGANNGFVNRDAAVMIDNKFILWDGYNYEIYNNTFLLNSIECNSSLCNIDYLLAFKYNDTIVVGSENWGTELLIEKLYLTKKDAKIIPNSNILNNNSVNAFHELKSTDSCIYYCSKNMNNVILKKLPFNGKEQNIYESDLNNKKLLVAHLQKDFFIVQYEINNKSYFDLLDLRLNRTLKKVKISTTRKIVNVEFTICGGYFIFTTANNGGRIGGFFYFNNKSDSAFLIEELESPAFTHPLGDIPQIFKEHDRLYFYRENKVGWYTLSYYELTDLCKKVYSRDKMIVYPNPAHNLLYLTTNQSNVLIYNTVGQLLRREVSTKWNSEQFIDISDLADGVYFLRVNNTTLRFIKY